MHEGNNMGIMTTLKKPTLERGCGEEGQQLLPHRFPGCVYHARGGLTREQPVQPLPPHGG